MSMTKDQIRTTIIGNPSKGIAGMQDDWWTSIAPDLWNSHNSYLRDLNGNEYLDFSGFFSTSVVRFDHPKIRDKNFLDQLARAAIYRPSLADFWTQDMAEFVDTFRRVAVPEYMQHLFFIDGGSLAVENAMKAAFDWKVRLNMRKGLIKNDPVEEKQPLGSKILMFERAFHGRSGYTLSMTHTIDPRKYKYFPKFDWFRVNPPVYFFDNNGNITNSTEVIEQQKNAINEIKSILKQHADDIAAFIIEPIQCEGGDRHIPIEFFKELRTLTEENDILLIYDEVQTGLGTTGAMWGHQHFGEDARPDILAFSKKAQVGGVMANYEKMSVIKENSFNNEFESKSRLNSTWGGNPVDMVRCKVLCEIMDEEDLLSNVKELGQYLLGQVQQLCQEFSDIIENPRGRGFLFAFDAKTPELKGKIWQAFYDENFLGLTCGSKTLRFRPHLDLTRDEADEAVKRIRAGLGKVK